MTSIEIKAEIQNVPDQIPEGVLQDLLNLLKELQTKTADQFKLADNLRKILSKTGIV